MQEENTHGLEVQRLLRPYPQGGEDAGITNQTNGGVMDTEHGQRKCHKSYISCCQLLPANERPTNKHELSTYVFQRCSSLGHRSRAAQANEAVSRKKLCRRPHIFSIDSHHLLHSAADDTAQKRIFPQDALPRRHRLRYQAAVEHICVCQRAIVTMVRQRKYNTCHVARLPVRCE